tara:strand:- start:735 stop:923 length:189 start_codon:yes stop_codon:yes gene_type:complete
MKEDKKKATLEAPKTDEAKMTEVIDVLRTQINHHNTMLIKAQGALEVLLQLTESKDDTKTIN